MEAIKRFFRKWAVIATVVTIMSLLPSENRENIQAPPIVEFIHNAENELSNQLHIISPFDQYYHGVISYQFSPSKQYILINIKSNASGFTRMFGKLPGEVLSPVYTTKLINMRSGKEIKTFDFTEPAIMYEFSPNEKILLIAGLKKPLASIVGWKQPSTLHAYPSGKRAPSDTGEILEYDLFDIDSQSVVKTLENIQAINFNDNNELIIKYDDGFAEKMTFSYKPSSIRNLFLSLFGESANEIEVKAEDFPVIQTMYDVQANKTFCLTLANKDLNGKEEAILCPNTISYDFSPQKQYLFIKQLPNRSIPTQSLQSIARNVVSGTAGYLAGTSIRALLGGLPGIITGGAFAPVIGYVVGNIVSDVRSISSLLTIKNGKTIAVFKNVVTYEFNPDETRLLILCPEEGWIKLGDTPVYQLFDTETGTKIKTFPDVQAAYFKENELIIRKNGKETAYDPEAGDFGKKEEQDRARAYALLSEQQKKVASEEILPKDIRQQKEYERTLPGMMQYAAQAIKDRGVQRVYETAQEFLGKNKTQEEILPTTARYEYPAVNLTEVVVAEEPKKVVMAQEQQKNRLMEPKFYESAWEQVLDTLSDKKNLDKDGFPKPEWKRESIEFALQAIEEDEKTAEQLANELYNTYLNEITSRQRVKRDYSIKDPIKKAQKIREDFLQELNQQLLSKLKEEQELKDIAKEKEHVHGELIEEPEESIEEEIKKRKLVEKAGTSELTAALEKAIKPALERQLKKIEIAKAQIEALLNELSIQGLSQEWQNNIITHSIELIKLAQKADKNNTSKEIISSINTAIDDYRKTLWFPNTKAILNAKNSIVIAILNGTFDDFAKEFKQFNDYLEEFAGSPIDSSNVNESSGAHWIYDQNEGYFNINPATLETVANTAAHLINTYGVPIKLIESIMNLALQKVRKGQTKHARLRSANDLGIMKVIKEKITINR